MTDIPQPALVRERPILFSGPLVRAILDGRKTVTRRIVRADLSAFVGDEDDDGVPLVPHPKTGCLARITPPYGTQGDRLWVRETWGPNETEGWGWIYRADWPAGTSAEIAGCIDKRWHPAIHMPRRASRIALEVTSVRVERLQEIADNDIRAEGVVFDGKWWLGAEHDAKGTPKLFPLARQAWESRWDSINGDRASWDRNPWVWRIEFRRLRP